MFNEPDPGENNEERDALEDETLNRLLELKMLVKLLKTYSFRRCATFVFDSVNYEMIKNATGKVVCTIPGEYIDKLHMRLAGHLDYFCTTDS